MATYESWKQNSGCIWDFEFMISSITSQHIVRLWQIVNFFFLGFSLYFFKSFNQRLTVRRENRWPKESFQSVGAQTWTKELLVKPKIATLKLSIQPFGQLQWINCEKVYDFRLSPFFFFFWYGVMFVVVEVKERELSEKVTEGNHDERLRWG